MKNIIKNAMCQVLPNDFTVRFETDPLYHNDIVIVENDKIEFYANVFEPKNDVPMFEVFGGVKNTTRRLVGKLELNLRYMTIEQAIKLIQLFITSVNY